MREKRLRNDDFESRKASLAAPAEPGDYELRYWNGDNKAVLATRTITVTETEVSLAAPDGLPAGEPFVVDWIGPGARYDEVRIVDGNGKTTGSVRLRNAAFEERKVKIKAPKEPGHYELRYWNGENKVVLATRALRVE